MLIYRQGLEIHGAAADSDEDSKYNIAAIQIHPDGSVAATDGQQFLRMNAAVDEPDLFTATEVGELSGEDLEQPITIPADVAKAFLAASKRKKAKGQKAQQIVVAAHEGAVTLATADGKTKRTFLIDSDDKPFPVLKRAIPTGQPVNTVTLDVALLLKTLTALARCGASSVAIAYHGPAVALRLTAVSYIDDGMAAIDGCLMPMRAPADASADDTAPVGMNLETGEIREAGDAEAPSIRAAVNGLAQVCDKDGSSVTLSGPGIGLLTIDKDGIRRDA